MIFSPQEIYKNKNGHKIIYTKGDKFRSAIFMVQLSFSISLFKQCLPLSREFVSVIYDIISVGGGRGG